ncbi:hypothetical protein [Azonexus hydrophilus]|uniref:hypothetical protein n=1 Tax=Azonexus hydrophilus TaxID=418702 RepID=UPI00196407AE|nr:hypothetical protein [Azonexus hydrophilus]
MGCNQDGKNGKMDGLDDASSAALDGLDAFIKDQEAKGINRPLKNPANSMQMV